MKVGLIKLNYFFIEVSNNAPGKQMHTTPKKKIKYVSMTSMNNSCQRNLQHTVVRSHVFAFI